MKVKLSKNQASDGQIGILLAVLVMAITLVIAFTISEIIIKQMKMSVASSESVRAYEAADSGLEWALAQVKNNPNGGLDNVCGTNCTLGTDCPAVGDASYCIKVEPDTAVKWSDVTAVMSIGKAGEVRRSIKTVK
ncbi:hypothetical protein J7J12_02540 [bacterium]|nr:hypothetical protein [bacterium]